MPKTLDYWGVLPIPLVSLIEDRLDYRSCCAASQVCKSWYKRFSDDRLWEHHLQREWPGISFKQWNLVEKYTNWKRIFYSQRSNQLKRSNLASITFDKKLLFSHKYTVRIGILARTPDLPKTTKLLAEQARVAKVHNVDSMLLLESLLITSSKGTISFSNLNQPTTKVASTGQIHSLAASSAHKVFSGDNKGINAWDAISGKNSGGLSLGQVGKCSNLTFHSGKLAFTQNTKLMSLTQIFDVQSNKSIFSIQKVQQYCKGIFEDENTFYAHSNVNEIEYFDIRSGNRIGSIIDQTAGYFDSFLGNKNYVAVGKDNYDLAIADRRKLGTWVREYRNHHSYIIASLDWLSDSVVATAAWNGSTGIFDVNLDTAIRSLQFTGKGFAVKKVDENILATGHADNCMSLWNYSTGEELASLEVNEQMNTTNYFEIMKNENYLAGLVQSRVSVYDLSEISKLKNKLIL